MKVGIFGGTFNPPHKTHINIALQAKKQLSLDKLIVMPCGIPPHKHCSVDGDTRLQLCRLAFSDFADVSDYELNKQGKSYTVETLRTLRQTYPDATLYLIIGGDSFRDFSKWYCPAEIAQLATLVVAERDHKTFKSTESKNRRKFGTQTVFLDVTPNDVSSTEIRLRYQFGWDNKQFVSTNVDDYVLQRGLYAEYRPLSDKLKGYLTSERLQHTFYVVKRGLQFATADEQDKVFVACLLHDCAKYVAPCDYAKYGFVQPADMPDAVVHSFLGANVARQDFGITDEEILSAIAYHTTGCPNMSRLQKIVYVADKTEQSRNYPLSHLLKGNLHQIFLKCLEEANSYTVTHHDMDQYYGLSKETLQYYLPKYKK